MYGTRELQSMRTLATPPKFKAQFCENHSLALGLLDANPSEAACACSVISLQREHEYPAWVALGLKRTGIALNWL